VTRFLRHVALALGLAAGAAHAATLSIATAFDPQTMDPHALALLYHSRIAFQIYDSLVHRDAQFRLEPGLATEWKMTSPTTWRLRIRPGVVFHDAARSAPTTSSSRSSAR
jgi:peptide/nickel transport system substrate-binding protein